MEDRIGTIPIRHTEEIDAPSRSVLYWGSAKTGKTHNCLTWPDPFVIYWDDNLATMLKFDVPFISLNANQEPLTFEEFRTQVLPAILNRKIPAKTIVFDSYSYCSQRLRRKVQGTRDKMRIQDWGKVFDPLFEITHQLCEMTQKEGGYNFVATVHEKDKWGAVEGDEDDKFIQYDPAIQGQFKDWLPRFFDTVLVTSVEEATITVDNRPQKSIRYIANTVPPNKYWICGDGVGGDTGLGDKNDNYSQRTPNKLPPKMSGTYPALMEAWGYTDEDK